MSPNPFCESNAMGLLGLLGLPLRLPSSSVVSPLLASPALLGDRRSIIGNEGIFAAAAAAAVRRQVMRPLPSHRTPRPVLRSPSNGYLHLRHAVPATAACRFRGKSELAPFLRSDGVGILGLIDGNQPREIWPRGNTDTGCPQADGKIDGDKRSKK